MEYYRCENPNCRFVAEEEPDVCPLCGGAFFLTLTEEELSAADWVMMGNLATDQKRHLDALACYQRAAAMGDTMGLTNLGWCLEAGIGVEANPTQAVLLYAQAEGVSLLLAGDLRPQRNIFRPSQIWDTAIHTELAWRSMRQRHWNVSEKVLNMDFPEPSFFWENCIVREPV